MTPPVARPDVERLRELLAKATAGPWRAINKRDCRGLWADGIDEGVASVLRLADLELLAALRNEAPALLTYLLAVEGEREALKQEVAHLHSCLRDEPLGTPIRIVEAMFELAHQYGHPQYSSRHALSFIAEKLAALTPVPNVPYQKDAEAIELLRKIDLSLDGGEQLQHIHLAFERLRTARLEELDLVKDGVCLICGADAYPGTPEEEKES